MQLVQLVRRAQHILSRKSAQVMANMALAMLMLFGRVVKTLFFGTLRHAEIERLQDRSRIAVIETCLMMTMFREEFSFHFAALFAVLLFVKIFHWLTRDRINFIEQQPNAGRMTHVRIVVMMGLLLAVDSMFVAQHVATSANGAKQHRSTKMRRAASAPLGGLAPSIWPPVGGAGGRFQSRGSAAGAKCTTACSIGSCGRDGILGRCPSAISGPPSCAITARTRG